MYAKQIQFKDDEDTIFGGILVNDEYIICGCCGGIFEKEEVTILKEFENWVDISEEIIGE